MEKKKPTFEEAFGQLGEVTARLEAGGLTLEEMLSLYEWGMEQALACLEMLEGAELRVKKLSQLPGGGYEVQPLEEDQEEELPF